MADNSDGWFEEIVSFPNLYRAAHAAALGKRYNDEVAFFRFLLEPQIERLHGDLAGGRYRHGGYKVFRIFEPKEREIAKAPFRDRVVHHAVHDVIEPVIDRSFIHDSYACRRGKGTHAAVERAQSFLLANDYCLHGDVTKYFPSIDRSILRRLLFRHVREERLRRLLDEIIDSARDVFPGKVGLPIGNLTSQFFANLYLHQLDFFVKHVLKCRYYIRYMDDFVLFDDDPALVLKWRDIIRQWLSGELHLRLNENKTGIYPARRGFTFLGFNLSRYRRRVCARGMRRFLSRLKEFRYLKSKGLITEKKIVDSVQCWRAHSSYADAARLRAKLAKEAGVWSEPVSLALRG